MKCPNCGSEHNLEDISCECGYNFATKTLDSDMLSSSSEVGSSEEPNNLRVIILAIVGTIAVFAAVVLWEDLSVRFGEPSAQPSGVASQPPTPTEIPEVWCKPGGRFWVGLELYRGNPGIGRIEKFAVVLGGDSDNILVRFIESGSIEWKDRATFGYAAWSWCRCDDPAIEAERWKVIHKP